MSYRPLSAVVLAAGEGTRMRSATPKVLHPVCGRPIILHVLDALTALPLERIVVVVGHGAERVTKVAQEHLRTEIPVEYVEQRSRLGTGDAASVALTAFPTDVEVDDDLLLLVGDVPLLRPETLADLATAHRRSDAAATMLTAVLDDPRGYGRVLRDRSGEVQAIVEEADATDEQRAVREVNPSIYCFRRTLLAPALRRLVPTNAQGEHYLTDVIAVLRNAGHRVGGVPVADPQEILGVNDRVHLAAAEAVMRRRVNEGWMRAGVTMVDPAATYVDVGVTLAPDVRLLPNSILEGRTTVAEGAVIGPDTRLCDTVVGPRAVVTHAVAREAEIGEDCTVGPYVSLRPGTRLWAGAHVGTFVEVKASEIGPGAKVPHLAYVGDAEIGEGVNIGAGTITANYDGRRKHRTVVGPDARIGSNTVLVAPVTVGAGAYTGAGAVVRTDVPPGALAAGVPAAVHEGWVAARSAEGAGEGAGGETGRDDPARSGGDAATEGGD